MDLFCSELNPGIIHFYLIPELTNHDLFTFFTLTKDNYLDYLQESKKILKNRYSKCFFGSNYIMVTWKRPNYDFDGPTLFFQKNRLTSLTMRKNETYNGLRFVVSYDKIQGITPYPIDNGVYIQDFRRFCNDRLIGGRIARTYDSDAAHSVLDTASWFDTFVSTAKIDSEFSIHKAYQDIRRTIKKYERLYYPK